MSRERKEELGEKVNGCSFAGRQIIMSLLLNGEGGIKELEIALKQELFSKRHVGGLNRNITER